MNQPAVEISDLLRIPFLAGLVPAELDALLQAGRRLAFERGEYVFRAGDPGKELCVLVDGEVGIELDVAGGPPRILATLGSGTVFGEVSFLLGNERTASARALRETRVLAFSREALEGVSPVGKQAVISMVETIARILALRLANVDRELADICARIRTERPDAIPLLESFEEKRRRVRHEWSF